MPIVRVALDVPLSTLFDYATENNFALCVGQRVLVPFGRKQMLGVVLECVAQSAVEATRIKVVERVLSDVPPLPGELLQLLRFCSDYYHHPLGMTVLSALPTRLRSEQPLKQPLSYGLSDAGKALELDHLPARKVVQRRVLTALRGGAQSAAQIRAIAPSANTALQALLEAGWVQSCTEVLSAVQPHTFNPPHTLTSEQQRAVDAVRHTEGYACFLLHGITGSGKTEVYVHLMQHALAQGQQVLLLVPEINLTPQLEQYFQSRFPATELLSLHSGMSDGTRAQNWLRAQSGQARIILGTRLSVFTPLPHLGLILVDEEHDASFKQQDGLRYSARDVAIFRANQRGVPIVLGSATPSLESFYNAKTKRYTLLSLTQRAAVSAQLPSVRCLNISNAILPEGISPALLTAVEQRLERGEQSLMFINRRGYAPVLMCTACGWLSGCHQCAGKLVLHLKDRRLRCHHCGHQSRVPHACPSCGNADLQAIGNGTQRVESTLQSHFPAARILRVDRDSTRNQGAWNAMRQQIADGAVDILVGTQMLAKGHDFPNLTLVGVLNPDSALYSSDFRASEKLFAQLVQVAGRAGRADKAGEVLVQTAFPDHPLFRALREHDYDGWANTLLTEREQASFPPFCHQVLLRAEAKQAHDVFAFLQAAREAALGLQHAVEIYGVVPAALPKRANHFLAQLLVQCPTRKPLQAFLRAWTPHLDALPSSKLRWSLDIDPLDF